MSTIEETSTKRERTTIYVAVAVALLLLAVVGLIAYRGHERTESAEAKADQLIAAIEEAGYRAPSKDRIVGVLGDDGGALCVDPSGALTTSALRNMLTNGAGGPGARPIIADSLVFKGQLLVVQIYCPDELEEFEAFVNELKTADVVNE